MISSSKTGLIPVQKYKILKSKQKNNGKIESEISKPVVFSIRPYNPYSKDSSIHCNYSGSSDDRNTKKMKNSMFPEGWNNNHDIEKDHFETVELNNSGQIPDEYFRRYTDTDSRPITPSPTTESVRTRIRDVLLNTRRCITPEPEKIDKRKTIILDLRRSHSQETLHWKGSTDTTQPSIHDSPANTCHEKFSPENTSSSSIKKLKEFKPKNNINSPIISDKPITIESPKHITCINDQTSEDSGHLQRRGKTRKKSKNLAVPSFHLSQDPETQVSTLGPDSLNASTRPSLVPNSQILLTQNDVKKESQTIVSLEGSFLTEAAFNILKIELDDDAIENTFERYLNKARQEAIKFIPSKRNHSNPNTASFMESALNSDTKLPQKLSKSSSRFEMPVNLTILQDITVFQYLSQYVWISRQKRQLYKRIFLKYVIQDQSLEYAENYNNERLMSISNIPKAIEEALGFYGNEEMITNIMMLVFDKINSNLNLNFRSWCGIVAFAERYALSDSLATDSCDELEKADFETMEEHINTMNVSKALYDVLYIIRKGHCIF